MSSSGGLPVRILIWSAARPILKFFVVMGFGAFLARKNILTLSGSRSLASIIILLAYPCLLFSNIVSSVDDSTLGNLGLMTVAAILLTILGYLFGVLVRKLAKPPKIFSNGCVMATTMGNWGDLPLAVISSIGEYAPFNRGDTAIGIAYVSAFLCFANIYFFLIGYRMIASDFASSKQADRQEHDVDLSEPQIHNDAGDIASKASKADAISLTELGADPESRKARYSSPGTDAHDETHIAEHTHTDNVVVVDVELEPPRSSQEEPSKAAGSWAAFKSASLRGKFDMIFTPKVKALLKGLFSPANSSIFVALILALIPATKGLFVYSPSVVNQNLGNEPVFKFLLEASNYIGQVGPPLGLVNLGAALGRLSRNTLLPWRISISVALVRLVILPVIGIALTQLLSTQLMWIPQQDKMLRFVLMFMAICPTAGSTVYFTQMLNPTGRADEIASVVLVQYILAFVTMTAGMVVILYLLS
ncbi:auxin efflux carrier [Polychytrium aggregatum]|uniref:auxin efflux carrier n=1 Tax=Polychytrium aggregatum TaxID=110093 RepID=UPI0022FE7B17|nr:auxin efflux carrier [Polychytrium aggregatum]KAI9208813.1 auxin efflux carrier [Polychytrium aggregatum]